MAAEACALLVSLDLQGHVHSATCGHARVEHEDHWDYLVDDELHHVAPSCCGKRCTSGPVVVSHGRLSTLSSLKLRWGASQSGISEQRGLLVGTPISTAADGGDAGPSTSSAPADAPPQPPSGTAALQTTRVFAAGICCPMEVPLVHSVLGGMPGVHSVEVSVMAQTVVVQHDPGLAPPGALVAALNGAMLEASLTIPRAQAQVRGRWVPPWHILAGAVLLAVSLLHFLAAPTGASGLDYLEYVSLGAVALCLPRIALRAALALRRGIIDIHMLVTLATAGAIALEDYVEAAAVVVLFAVAEHWERCSTDKARDAVAAVLMLRPETARLAATGEQLPVEAVAVGTEVLVVPGESVPLDGVVVTGESAVDENMLTGESAPVPRRPGDAVHAGTLNVGSAPLLVRTTAAAGDTAVARMAQLVEQAASQQSPAEAAVTKFARIYTPVILVACTLLAFLPWIWAAPEDRKDWVYLSLQLLVTACPCALVLSTPAAVVCTLARAAQKGVLIKGGAALERLRRVSVVTFDKTGTLTKGSFQVVDCQTCNGWTRPELLRLLGSAERGSSHPLAAAVLGYAAAQGAVCDAPMEDSTSVPGAGLLALVDGRRLAAGTAALLAQHVGVEGPEVAAAQAAIDAEGATACFVAVDGQLAGWISARDVVRPEAAQAVSMLSSIGVRAAMLTGDAPAAAAGVGAATGIPAPRVHARLLPGEKLAKVAEYKQDPGSPRAAAGCCPGLLPAAACCVQGGGDGDGGRGGALCGLLRRRKQQQAAWVAHVGDGVNDAPALAAADAGIAMGVAGSAAALEAGSVALFTNDVRAVPAALMLARAASAVIWQNIVFSVATKVAVLVPAMTGHFTLWGAVAMDAGSALLVVANALRLLKWRWPLDEKPGAKGKGKAQADCCASGACSALQQHSHAGHSHARHSHSHHAHGCCSGGAKDHSHAGHSHSEHAHGCCGGDAQPHSHAGHSHTEHGQGCCSGGEKQPSHAEHEHSHSKHSHGCCSGGAKQHSHAEHSHSQHSHASGQSPAGCPSGKPHEHET
ncbi:hypothetical protein ABPG77_006744 [Micractinium sp. CCAP 211/92]